MNYVNKYNEYSNFLVSEEYKKYVNYLHIFFNNKVQYCPRCNKYSIFKAYSNSIIFMKCNNVNCDWKVSIQIAEYIDLNKELYKNTHISKDLLYNLINTNNFKTDKDNYLGIKNSLNDINDIFTIQNKELNEKITEKIKLYNELSTLNYKRKNVFSNITKSFDNKTKTNLLEIYKNEYKNITEARYNSISKEFNISLNDVKNILLWFDISNNYIKIQIKLKDINQDIHKYTKTINKINNNMMINLPIIKEDKDVKINEKDLEIVNTNSLSEEVSEDVEGVEGVEGEEDVEGVEGVEDVEGVEGVDGEEDVEGVEGVEDVEGEEGVEGVEEEEEVSEVKNISIDAKMLNNNIIEANISEDIGDDIDADISEDIDEPINSGKKGIKIKLSKKK